MSKFTDAVRNNLISYFNAGDQPTEAQFTELITKIQEGIEEHQHDATGDGDGIAALGPLTSLTMANGAWVGIGAALERIVFDAAGDIAVTDANFAVEMTTNGTLKITVINSSAGANARSDILAETDDSNSVRLTQFGSGHALADQGWVFTGGANNALVFGTVGTERGRFTTAGVFRVSNLAGVGNRAVIAAADGTLSAP